MHEPVRVMIVEDQLEIREGLRFLIETTPNYCCTGVFGSMEEALPAISGPSPMSSSSIWGCRACRVSTESVY